MSTIFETLADGLDASTDGRGWGAEHEKAKNLANAAPDLLASLKDLLGDAPLIDAHTCECRFCGRDYSGEERPLDLYECAEGTIEDGGCPGMIARATIAAAEGGA